MADIVLGGRTFKVIDFSRRTVRQDHYLQRYIRETGADTIMPVDGEDNVAYLVRLQTHIIDSGKAPELIAGYLMPVDKTQAEFTPDIAAETAKHIGLCNTPADHELITELVAEVAFGFFKQGLEQWQRSLVYLQQASAEASPDPQDTVH